MILNALTIDVEDYFQVTGFERQIDRDRWDGFESRVVVNTHRLLRLLAQYDVRATFFVLGWVAQRFPQLVRDIYSDGHELGSHSFWHRLVYQQTPEEFREDLVHSRRALEDAVGVTVMAYRAPSFSITRRSLWALDVLAAEGFEIDASISPIYHDRYGIPDADPYLHEIRTAAGSLWEFPASVLRMAGVNLPVSGGGYFRLYPAWLTRMCLARINERKKQPFAFYVHPWEFDPEQPRLRAGTVTGRMRHYVNLASTRRKLESLLTKFRFGTLSQAIAATRAEVELGTAI